jgi:Mce-associated membrane protein
VTDLVALPRHRASVSSAPVVIARAEAVNFFTLSYQQIDADLANVLALATGSFKTQYAAKEATIKKGILAGDLSSSATVAQGNVGVELQTSARVVVLVAVDATTTAPKTSKSKATSETDRYRIRLTVNHVNGRWLVSSIEQVG